MRKKRYRKHKKGTISKWLEKMMHLGTREMIIISSAILAATLIIILFMAVIKVSKDRALGEGGMEAQGISEEATAAGGAQNTAEGEEDTPKVETATAGMKTESTPDTTVLAKKEGAKDGYLNRCVFLGDSRTVAMVNYGFFNDDAALAQIGIAHPSFASNKFVNNAGKEYTLKSYLGSHQAPVIYILLGVNGINGYSEEKYKNSFLTLIDSVAEMAPNSNIVLVAIGPVDDNGIYKNSVQNAWIDKYNAFLLETAREKRIYYLDIAEILKGSDGQVKSEYNGGDGLHYSGKGCEAIFRYIVEHPVPGISDDGKYVVKYIKPDPNKVKVTMGNESGIDEGKLKDIMGVTGAAEAQTSSAASTGSSDEAASEASSLNEEAKKKAEEEKKKKEEEEKKKAEEEEKKKKEEEEKKKKEEEEKKKKEEEEKKKKEEEEKKKKEEEERKKKEEEERQKEEEEKEKEEEEKEKEEEEEKKEDESEKEEDESGEKEEGSEESGSGEAGSEGSSSQSEGENGNNPEGD